MTFFKLFVFAIFIHATICQRKLNCLDNKGDVTSQLWTSNADIISSDSVSSLPKSFGDLKNLGQISDGVWYIEGPSSAKEITFKSPLNLYPSRSKTVQIYLKYYTNAKRRLSLFPVKLGPSGGSLLLLPSSSSNTSPKWSETTANLDATETPVELTAYLGPTEYVIFDKIVVAVDTPMPSDLSISCRIMNNPPTLAPPLYSSGSGGSSPNFVTPGRTLSSSSRTPPSTPTECPVLPQIPECKCNCLCNCSNNTKC